MKAPERIILVTGAPRSGTTPVGDLLSRMSGARMVYEPMGPNGDQNIGRLFAMPGEAGFGSDDLSDFVTRLSARKLRMAKVAHRRDASAKMAVVYRLLGTQAQHSYRKYRFDPFAQTVIWKDPFAAFCAEYGATGGYRTVMTVRPPLAHAASFKRMGWVSRAAEVYPRYAATFGPLDGFADKLARHGKTPVGSGALMWRMIHARFAEMPEAQRQHLFLLDMEALGRDEPAGYGQVFDWLNVEMPQKIKEVIAKRVALNGDRGPKAGLVHDFDRSAKAANAVWKDTLTEEEVETVKTITGDLWERIRFNNR